MSAIYREITPLTPNDCFRVFSRIKKGFNFPLHYHDEYELNFVINGNGSRRIVGDHIETIDDMELVLVGSNVNHGWFTHNCKNPEIHEITIQFHKNLFDEQFLARNQLSLIKNILDLSFKGILFSKETAERLMPRLMNLTQKNGFESILEFMSILHELSISDNIRMLSTSTFVNKHFTYNSQRIEDIFTYLQNNYQKNVTLAEVASTVNMTEISLSRFIKKCSSKTFIDSLNEIRLGHTTRLLIDTSYSIAEISFKCGFNNLSYFNRTFKKKMGCTPKEFRENYTSSNRKYI